MITSTLDSKAVNKILSTWLEIPVAVIMGEKKQETTKAFTAIWNKRNWRFTSHTLSYKSSARKLWGIQRYTLIVQTQSRLLLPTCSSHHSKHEPMPRRVSDLSRPAFILVLASSGVTGQRLSVCRMPFTHTSHSIPLKGVRGVNRSTENACNNTELGFSPPQIKWCTSISSN